MPNDDVLLRLIIQGQSPQEIQQLAQATQGELNRQSKFLLDQLTALHRGATEAQTADVLNQIQREIKARQTKLATVTTLIDAEAKAAEKAAAAAQKAADDNIKQLQKNFEFAMRLANQKEREDEKQAAAAKKLADDAAKAAHDNAELHVQAFTAIAVGAEATFSVIEAGWGKFKELGEQIIKNAQIYGSLRGSIDSLREATGGEVADIDLITTKNRAFEKDLKLTDAEFAAVAKQAKHYGDVLGTDTKDGLDKLVDGLATGRVKMLQSAGVIVDTEAAYRKFADAQGLVIDKMTDQEKLLAFQTAALEKIKEKTKEFGEEGVTVANVLEIAFAKTKNAITGTLAAIGNAKLSAPTDYGAGDLERIRQDSIAHGDPGEYQRALAVRAKARAEQEAQRREAARRDYTDEEMAARQDQLLGNYDADPSKTKSYTEAETAAAALGGGERYGAYSKPTGNQQTVEQIRAAYLAREALNKKAEEVRKKQEQFNQQFDELLRQMGGGKKSEITDGRGAHDDSHANDFKSLGNIYDPLGSQTAAPSGLSNSVARTEALKRAQAEQQAQATAAEDAMSKSGQQSVVSGAQAAFDLFDEQKAKIDKLRERAGGGLMGDILFGPDGSEKLLSDIDAFKGAAADAMGMVSDAGMKMADALGASLAAFVSGDNAKKKSIRQTTHDVLEALSAQAYSRAIFETAEGLASLALGPIGGVSAGMHFAAAGMFAAVGTGAGLAARGVGQDATAGKGAGSGSGSGAGGGMSTSTSGSGGFGSNGQRSSGGGDAQQVVINVSTMFGSPEEIGRSLDIALAARKAQTGRLLSQETA